MIGGDDGGGGGLGDDGDGEGAFHGSGVYGMVEMFFVMVVVVMAVKMKVGRFSW